MASMYPFISQEIAAEYGFFIGRQDNGSMVMLDNFEHRKYNNANMLILGSSGAGKTYFLQSLALRLREKQTHVFIISPKNGSEFMRACEAIGGSFIIIAPGSKHNVNIMELRQKVSGPEELDMDRMTSYLAEKIQKVMGFFYLLMPEITYEEKQVLDEALVDTYAKFGITNDNDSLWDPEHPDRFRPMPTLKDLYETLEEIGADAKRLKNVLARFVTGSASSFSNQTNVSLDNKYVVLDDSRLGDEMIPIGMYVALDYVWDKAREDILTKKAIIMDEGWKLIGPTGSKDSAKFVLNVFKLIRGFNGSGIIASQDLNDFLTANGGEFGRGIINNSEIQIVMRTKQKEMSIVAEALNLTAEEEKRVLSLRQGGFLMAGSIHAFFQVETSPREHMLISMSQTDLQKQYSN